MCGLVTDLVLRHLSHNLRSIGTSVAYHNSGFCPRAETTKGTILTFFFFVHFIWGSFSLSSICLPKQCYCYDQLLTKSNEQVEGADLGKSLHIFSGKSSNFLYAQYMVIKKVVKIVELQKVSSDNWTLSSWIQGVLAPLESSDSFIFGMCLLIQNLKNPLV